VGILHVRKAHRRYWDSSIFSLGRNFEGLVRIGSWLLAGFGATEVSYLICACSRFRNRLITQLLAPTIHSSLRDKYTAVQHVLLIKIQLYRVFVSRFASSTGFVLIFTI